MVSIEQILNLCLINGARIAQPGEFTKRAFLNGRIDLVQAEAVCDVINASSEQALIIAEEQLEGRLSATVEKLKEALINVLAELEASMDFPEEDIHPDTLEKILDRLIRLENDLEILYNSYSSGHIVR